MARFKKRVSREVPSINTGSMSDIIFMFLFFFMVITTMRENPLMVRVLVPQASEVQKLEKKSLECYIYVGRPMQSALGTEPRIQLNDHFASLREIPEFIEKEREQRDAADRKMLMTSLKVDQDTRMGIITDIKQELRKCGTFRINYSTRKVPSVIN